MSSGEQFVEHLYNNSTRASRQKGPPGSQPRGRRWFLCGAVRIADRDGRGLTAATLPNGRPVSDLRWLPNNRTGLVTAGEGRRVDEGEPRDWQELSVGVYLVQDNGDVAEVPGWSMKSTPAGTCGWPVYIGPEPEVRIRVGVGRVGRHDVGSRAGPRSRAIRSPTLVVCVFNT